MKHEKIISGLLDFYYDEKAEYWHKERIGRIEAYKYHNKFLSAGNIFTDSQ